MNFKKAVENTPDIATAYQPGLQALNSATKSQIRSTSNITGSIDIDKALEASHPTQPRWDYGIGVARDSIEVAVWVERHDANSKHIQTMISKLNWLKIWLSTSAPALKSIDGGEYYWIAPARIELNSKGDQARKLALAGLHFPTKHLKL